MKKLIEGVEDELKFMAMSISITIIIIVVGATMFKNKSSKKDVETIKAPSTNLENRKTKQVFYQYPSGDKGTLPYDWKTGEKGIELNQNKDEL